MYKQGQIAALKKLGFTFKTPVQAGLAHAGIGGALGAGAGAALSDEENRNRNAAIGGVLGAGTGALDKAYANRQHVNTVRDMQSAHEKLMKDLKYQYIGDKRIYNNLGYDESFGPMADFAKAQLSKQNIEEALEALPGKLRGWL